MAFTAQIVPTLTFAQYHYVKTLISNNTQVNEEIRKEWIEMTRVLVCRI
jgi:hypothetical protein